MAWSGTTVWYNWNNMQHINTHSYWTITTVCSYCENDVSSVCSLSLPKRAALRLRLVIRYASNTILWTQQVHSTHWQLLIKPGHSQPSVACGKQRCLLFFLFLKTLRSKSTKSYRLHWTVGCDVIVKLHQTWHEDVCDGEEKHLPRHSKNRTASGSWILYDKLPRRSPLLWPTFDLWSLSRRRHFLYLIHVQFFFSCMFLISLCFSLFLAVHANDEGWVPSMVRCDSSNTLWFIKDILLASRGKKDSKPACCCSGLPSKTTMARPHQRWSWKSQDNRGQPYTQCHFHLWCVCNIQ